MATLAAPVSTPATGKASAVRLMATAILAPSELDVMESLLQRLAKAFNHDGGGIEANGMAAVAVELSQLGCWIKLHPGESACELIAYWVERQNDRVPLE